LAEVAALVPALPRATRPRSHIFGHQATPEEENAPPPPPLPVPTSFAEAERYGLSLFKEKNFDGAKAMFEKSLNLKGTGWDMKRARSASASPVGGASNQGGGFVRVEFASKEEVQCAKYNIACCQAQLGNTVGALETLDQVFASGFDEFATVRKDASLSLLGQDLEALLEKYKKEPFFKLPFLK
jgi:hypothetical protein